jgi:hypothetical protein
MPFNSNANSFDFLTLGRVNEVGATYGLFRPNPHRPGFYICLYVGQTNNLRTRVFVNLIWPLLIFSFGPTFW